MDSPGFEGRFGEVQTRNSGVQNGRNSEGEDVAALEVAIGKAGDNWDMEVPGQVLDNL